MPYPPHPCRNGRIFAHPEAGRSQSQVGPCGRACDPRLPSVRSAPRQPGHGGPWRSSGRLWPPHHRSRRPVRSAFTSNVKFPVPGTFSVLTIDLGGTGTELVTWLGDLGPGAASLAIRRVAARGTSASTGFTGLRQRRLDQPRGRRRRRRDRERKLNRANRTGVRSGQEPLRWWRSN